MDWGCDIGVKCKRLGSPKASWPAFDGVNIVFPELKGENDTDGEETAGLEVMVGLEQGVMQRLRGMDEWTRGAQWRCSEALARSPHRSYAYVSVKNSIVRIGIREQYHLADRPGGSVRYHNGEVHSAVGPFFTHQSLAQTHTTVSAFR